MLIIHKLFYNILYNILTYLYTLETSITRLDSVRLFFLLVRWIIPLVRWIFSPCQVDIFPLSGTEQLKIFFSLSSVQLNSKYKF